MSTFVSLTDEQLLEMLQRKDATAYGIEVWTRELQRRNSARIAEEIRRLNDATNLLAKSSTKMEKLTLTLTILTVVLTIFAAVQIAIAVVQTWKMFHS